MTEGKFGALNDLIAANVERLRKAPNRRWSRQGLASRLDPPTSTQQIEKLEKSERELTASWVERIAAALGVPPVDLLLPDGVESLISESVAALAARILGRAALEGKEPHPATVDALAILLRQLLDTFARHPATRADPQALAPVIDFLARRSDGK